LSSPSLLEAKRGYDSIIVSHYEKNVFAKDSQLLCLVIDVRSIMRNLKQQSLPIYYLLEHLQQSPAKNGQKARAPVGGIIVTAPVGWSVSLKLTSVILRTADDTTPQQTADIYTPPVVTL